MIAGADGPLKIEGGGTRPVGNPVEGEPLCTAGLRGIVDYEPGALTLVARAGTPVAEIETLLAAEGQRLAFEPMDHRGVLGTNGTPTIGGVVAANVSGPRRIQAGACRDFLLGVRFVDGRGRILKNGGRVMKNVTGYDLVKLMAGSRGTLGVLTEVSFKVLPVPESMASVIIHGQRTDAEAVTAMTRALSSPYEVSGAWHTSDTTCLRLEGFANSVAYRSEKLTELLREFGEITVETDRDKVEARWRAVRDVDAEFARRANDLWRISTKPTDAPGLVARLPAVGYALDWGGGLIWASVEPGTDLRELIEPYQGHSTLMRASEETRAQISPFEPEAPAIERISRSLRSHFDPRGILNPGLMGAV